MDVGTKCWWQSRTVWASLLQVIVAALLGTGSLSPSGAELLHGEGADVIVALVTALLGAISLYGRVVATHRLR